MIEGFTCQRKVKPIEVWLQEEEPGSCHPCLLNPLASHYLGVLQEAKANEQIKKLEDAWATGEGLTIAKTMDIIKNEVGENLKKELIALDCFTQSYKEEAE